MTQRRGIAWLLMVAFVFLLAFIGGAGLYWRMSSNFVKPPLSLKLQIDYQLESALLLVYQSIASNGPIPLPATFTYEPPRREIMPGVMLSVLTVGRTPEELKLDAWAVGSRLERHLSARIFLATASLVITPETPFQNVPVSPATSTEIVASQPATPSVPVELSSATPGLSWNIDFLPRKAETP